MYKAQVLPPAPTSKTRYIEELHQQSKDRAARWPNTLEVPRPRSYVLVLDLRVAPAAWSLWRRTP